MIDRLNRALTQPHQHSCRDCCSEILIEDVTVLLGAPSLFEPTASAVYHVLTYNYILMNLVRMECEENGQICS